MKFDLFFKILLIFFKRKIIIRVIFLKWSQTIEIVKDKVVIWIYDWIQESITGEFNISLKVTQFPLNLSCLYISNILIILYSMNIKIKYLC